ncbi:MAG: flagellar basal body rod protein FlgB [Nocardioides sp.]
MSVSSFAAGDSVSSVLGFALDGLALRQQTIADNLANIDTPDYRATNVDFESALRAAVAAGDSAPVLLSGTAPSVLPTDTPVGPNGNSVDLRKETLAAVQSQFQYQLVARAVTDRFELVRTAAGQF